MYSNTENKQKHWKILNYKITKKLTNEVPFEVILYRYYVYVVF